MEGQMDLARMHADYLLNSQKLNRETYWPNIGISLKEKKVKIK